MVPSISQQWSAIRKRTRQFFGPKMEHRRRVEEHTHHEHKDEHSHSEHSHKKRNRIPVKRSEKYQFSGRGSYLYAVRKFNIQPPYAPFERRALIKIGSWGGCSSMTINNLWLRDRRRKRRRGYPRRTFRTILCIFVPLLLVRATMPLLSIWTLIPEVRIFGVFLYIFRWGGVNGVVYSSLLPPTAPITGHKVYDPSKSTTAELVKDATWSIAYGDGSTASGEVYYVLCCHCTRGLILG
jgi:hypothetical protein